MTDHPIAEAWMHEPPETHDVSLAGRAQLNVDVVHIDRETQEIEFVLRGPGLDTAIAWCRDRPDEPLAILVGGAVYWNSSRPSFYDSDLVRRRAELQQHARSPDERREDLSRLKADLAAASDPAIVETIAASQDIDEAIEQLTSKGHLPDEHQAKHLLLNRGLKHWTRNGRAALSQQIAEIEAQNQIDEPDPYQ